jgi:hypothetical protein
VKRWRALAAAIAVTAALGSCIGPFGRERNAITTSPPPCPSPGPVVVLTQGGSSDGVTPFTVGGGLYELTAEGFPHGGFFDPNQGVTRVWIGQEGTEPLGDPRENPPTQLAAEVYVTEGAPTQVTLPSGNFWIANSFGVRISGRSCGGAAISNHLRATTPT